MLSCIVLTKEGRKERVVKQRSWSREFIARKWTQEACLHCKDVIEGEECAFCSTNFSPWTANLCSGVTFIEVCTLWMLMFIFVVSLLLLLFVGLFAWLHASYAISHSSSKFNPINVSQRENRQDDDATWSRSVSSSRHSLLRSTVSLISFTLLVLFCEHLIAHLS